MATQIAKDVLNVVGACDCLNVSGSEVEATKRCGEVLNP